jgi:hypothetical protein
MERGDVYVVDANPNRTGRDNAIPSSICEPMRLDENAACDECGKYGAFAVSGRFLCADCFQSAGSCCPEFGKDDLWTKQGLVKSDSSAESE